MLFSIDELLSPQSKVLTDRNDAAFQELLKRWSDIDLRTPSAIIVPISEKDILETVLWALVTSTSFVIKSGGHSEWSTIGGDGVIIDLSEYSGVEIDMDTQRATLKGSVLSKEVAVRLAEAGLFTGMRIAHPKLFADFLSSSLFKGNAKYSPVALGNGNTVGAIPYFLGGGASITSSLTGFGSDQIVAARMISAKGDLIDVNAETHPDLLYALRGAGQFFGLVTQLTVQAYPLSHLGNDRGVIWSGMFVFPLEQSEEVCLVMKHLMDDATYGTGGLMMVMAPPPSRQPSLVISARLLGDPKDAKEAFKSLYDLQPLASSGGEVPIQNTSDGRETIGAKGGFKRFEVAGLHHFDANAFMKTVSIWKEMVAECPDAINTAFSFQWDSQPVKAPLFESAMSHHDIRYWQNNLVWHTDSQNRSQVDDFNERSIAVMRSGQHETEWVDFQNGTRTGPIQYRYRGVERLDRLKKLKKLWDPAGVFTSQLL